MTDKKEIKVGIIDGASPFFINLLKQKYTVTESDNPDYLFYSIFGNKHHESKAIKIFFTGENVIPNFNYCDYAMGFHYIHFEDRYMRLPLWRLYTSALDLALHKDTLDKDNVLNRKFCNMVVSNSKQTDGIREKFFDLLSQYKQVDSGGRYKNNVGGPVPNKLEFQKNYKFTLAFENISTKGYCTEKILEAFASNTVPIYYGDETVCQDFNPKAFINCHDYKSLNEVVGKVREMDNNPNEYLAMLNEPIFKDGKLPDKYLDDKILEFLAPIFDNPIERIRRCKSLKYYADIDYVHMKKRDVINSVKFHLINRVKKLFTKK